MADAGFNETEAVLAKMEKRVNSIYKTAVAESQEKLEKFMSQYAAEVAKKKAEVKAGKLTEEAFNKWRLGKIASSKRYQAMLDTLAADFANADKIAMSIVGDYMPEVYAINRNFAAFEVEKGSMMDTSFTPYDRQTVERLIKSDKTMLPKPKVDIPKDKRWNKRHIREQITQGILQGESIPKIAKRLEKVTDMDRSAAIRNARTATTGAQNLGRIDSYKRAKEMGIGLRQEWLATLDGRTRHTHRQLDGKKVEVGEKFPNGCRYPGDPQGPAEEVYNCRCTLVAALDNLDQSDAPRNSKLGNMSYEEWKNEKMQQRTYYYKPLDESAFVNEYFTAEDVRRINERFKQLDSVYHANVSNVMTTLARDQREWDLYHDNYIAHLLEEHPRMRKSTAEKRAIEVLGARPEKAKVLLGGDYLFSTGEMTINNYAVKIAGGVAEDIFDRKESIEKHRIRMQRRLEEGRTVRKHYFGNVGMTAESTFIHEYGHAIDATYGISENERFLAFYRKFTEEEIKFGLSEYAVTNEREFIAECFAESFMGETQGEISKQFMKLLKELI